MPTLVKIEIHAQDNPIDQVSSIFKGVGCYPAVDLSWNDPKRGASSVDDGNSKILTEKVARRHVIFI